ncbi:MAG: HAD-IB family hydrolase, partial [Mycobacterium sp.]
MADLESLADNASAKRALDDLPASAASAGSPEATRQPPIDLTAAAFFDVDNTLVQG